MATMTMIQALRSANQFQQCVALAGHLHYIAAEGEIGSRGTTDNNLIKENFIRFGIGLTLNDRWFIKTKYE